MSKAMKFNLTFNFVFALLLSSVLSVALPVIAVGHVSLIEFLNGLWQGTLVATIVGLIVPIPKVQNWFAGLFRLKEGTIAHMLVGKLAGTTVFVIILSFAMTLFMMGTAPGWVQASFATMPVAYILAYPCSIILNPIVLRVENWVAKPDVSEAKAA